MKLKYLFFLLCTIVLSVGFTACSDDNDESATVVGRWKVVHFQGYYKDFSLPEKNWEEDKDVVSNEIYQVNEDGTGNVEDDPFSWHLEGDQLSISQQGLSQTYTLLKLTDSEMVIDILTLTDSSELYEKYWLVRVK